MADQATEHATIEAPPDRIFAVLVDFERYPEWARDVKEAIVDQRDPEGRATQVTFRVGAMGRTTRYTLAYDYGRAPGELRWQLVEGDIMRRLDGRYSLSPGDDDGDTTDVTYQLTVELVVPMPGFVKRRAEGKIIGTALDELKKRVEG
jgi:ribosome-associated toxin RatA of RatAB toxin-antitoxin module